VLASRLGRAALAAAGLGALVYVVIRVGPGALLATMARAAPYLPLLVALEIARIGTEAFATAELLAGSEGRVPFAAALRAQVATYPIMYLAPAGRAAAETLKATLLARRVGAARATAAATSLQALVFLAIGAVSACATGAALHVTGASGTAAAIGTHAAVSAGMGLAILVVSRRRSLGRLLSRFQRVRALATAYQDAVRGQALLPRSAVLVLLLGRLLQVAQCGVLLVAVGGPASAPLALVATGIQFVASSAGDVVPMQIGAAEGAFALVSPTLAITEADGAAIAMLARSVQMIVALFTGLAALVWRDRLDR
jgi:hypothetical protein